LRILLCPKQRKRNQPGFTLIEMLIALAISMIIVIGTAAFMQHMLSVTADHSDKKLAQIEVHYVGFWIGEDVAQAQSITLANSTVDGYPIQGFPITLSWTNPDDGNTTIVYSVESMKDKLGRTLLKLNRTKDDTGTSTIAEYLDPSLDDTGTPKTRCYQKTEIGDQTVLTDVLVLEVTAQVDRRVESGRYEIFPRAYSAGNVTW
jgi:prepilin-type N-terminal cleavage/methylation domain-containing protein